MGRSEEPGESIQSTLGRAVRACVSAAENSLRLSPVQQAIKPDVNREQEAS